jgi:hypothetical protein
MSEKKLIECNGETKSRRDVNLIFSDETKITLTSGYESQQRSDKKDIWGPLIDMYNYWVQAIKDINNRFAGKVFGDDELKEVYEILRIK